MHTDTFAGSHAGRVEVLSPGIHSDQQKKNWLLVTEKSSYAIGVTPEGYLLNLHWGPRLSTLTDLNEATLPSNRASMDLKQTLATEEYPAFGGLRFAETAAKATFADGTRDLDLRFAGADVDEQAGLPTLAIHLQDAVYPFRVTLLYRVDTANDLIIRSAKIENTGNESVVLERVFSAVWHLPRQFAARQLTTLGGHWAGETRIQRQQVVTGTAVLESRKGVTGSHAYPWFALDTQASAEQGEVYFGTIAWSGNWTLRVATNITGATAISGGIHDHDFAWVLNAGEIFETPTFVAGFAADGFNGTRKRLHRYVRQQVLPKTHVGKPRPVLYNSWEATLFDVNEEGQAKLAERAADMGVELFVVDDGWFPARVTDNAGLGDWRVDTKKFPQGLKPLVDRVKALGMEFGLWFEPEMVNPDSDLYRAHPDWVYHFPTRPRSESRQQLVLNVGRTDVQDYLIDLIDRMVAENGITFIKWDMNRPISEPGWPEWLAQGREVRELWVRHVQGVYRIMDTLRERHPDLSIESCSSGGSRADLEVLRRTDQVWSSDNTHPDARLFIQEGISHIIPSRSMGAWITDTPEDRVRNEIPLDYRFHVSMMGQLGIGGHLMRWSDDELVIGKRWISIYKEIRHLVQDGDQHWLISPTERQGDLAAVECVSPDGSEAVIFAYRRSNPFWEKLPALRLQQLQPDAWYRVRVLGIDNAEEKLVSGASLLHRGLDLPLGRGSYASCIVHIHIHA